jgi:predicted phosphodiesterase
MLILVLYLLDFGGVSIVSGPFIQIVDDSSLAVIWTTNKKSTGYVEYGKDQNSLNRIYPSDNGVIDANTTLHKVIIPIQGNQEFIYRVGSAKIEGYFQNNVEYGNTVVSRFKEFKDFRQNDTLSFYILSDIHENTDIYKTFLSKDDYDFVVLNGDYVNSVDNDSVVVDKVLAPISIYTNGEKPVYFVRGNHETRGASLRDLPNFISLPQNRFYYTFSAGPLYAVVLDSGEDKEDSDIEYSRLADFQRYRELETEWLHKLPNSNEYKDAKYRIAFVHIPLNSYEDLDSSKLKDYQQQWRGILNDMDMDAVFSGHTHEDAVIEAGSFGSSYPIFIGGGESGSGKGYIAIKVEAAENNLKVSYLDTEGKVIYEYDLK